MLKKMMMKAMMSRQLKGMPEEQKKMILDLVEKNPEFFEKMAKEIKARTDKGEEPMMAMQSVAKEHQRELQELFLNNQQNKNESK